MVLFFGMGSPGMAVGFGPVILQDLWCKSRSVQERHASCEAVLQGRCNMARATRRRKKPKRTHEEKSAGRARASWRGMLRFGLVAFPVEAFNAHSVEGAPV